METFPDPFSSPAHHTRSLVISGLTAVTAVTTHGLAWARSFHSITTLTVDTHWWDDGEVSLSRLHGLSPTLTSLFVHRSSLPLSEAFNLTCSFPLLEDLSLCSFFPKRRHLTDEKNVPPTSPKLTGSLLLKGDTISMTRRLLNLPGGLRFSKITMGCSDAYLELVVDLVWRCSDTLESLCLDHFSSGAFPSAPALDRYFTADCCSQASPGCHHLTYPRPQSSKRWSFDGTGRAFSGSPCRFKLPNLQTSDRLRSPSTRWPPSLILLERRSFGNGRTSITCWSDCGPHVRFFQRSGTKRRVAEMIWECLRQVYCPSLREGGPLVLLGSTRNQNENIIGVIIVVVWKWMYTLRTYFSSLQDLSTFNSPGRGRTESTQLGSVYEEYLSYIINPAPQGVLALTLYNAPG